eukprot:24633-Eustigmatos_ZCMA.PRE.1
MALKLMVGPLDAVRTVAASWADRARSHNPHRNMVNITLQIITARKRILLDASNLTKIDVQR